MKMQGMCRKTGKWLNGKAHIVQSVSDLLTTRRATRILRRNYGSILPELIDRPLHESDIAIYAVKIAQDIDDWDRRVELKSLNIVEANNQGQARFRLVLRYGNRELEVFV